MEQKMVGYPPCSRLSHDPIQLVWMVKKIGWLRSQVKFGELAARGCG
jgi:hypothetical protein